MTLVLGGVPEPLQVIIARGRPNAFGLRFWDDTAMTVPTDLTGKAVELVLSAEAGDVTWAATVSGAVASWSLTALDVRQLRGPVPAVLLLDGHVVAAGSAEIR